jgi:hypothetical protein
MTDGEDEKTEAGETLAAMGRQMAEVAADLPRRWEAVKAETLAQVSAKLDDLRRTRQWDMPPMAETSDVQSIVRMETYFIGRAAEMVLTAVSLAFNRGAGSLAGEAKQGEQSPANGECHRPPATPENLGESL